MKETEGEKEGKDTFDMAEEQSHHEKKAASTDERIQRQRWIELKKTIRTQLDKLTAENIRDIVLELFKINLNRGRGLLVRNIMKLQMVKIHFIPIYASLIAILNSKIPEIGELLCSRLVVQFRKAYLKDQKRLCLSSCNFICHLVNQKVLDEIILLQILQMLLENPTNDSIEVASKMLLDCGMFLENNSTIAMNMIMNKLREILHDNAHLSKKSQHLLTVVFDARKYKFQRYPSIQKELDLVEEEDQETHSIELDEELEVHDELSIFTFDPDYDINEQEYNKIRDDILGSDDDESEEEDDVAQDEAQKTQIMEIKDMTEKNLLEHQKSIYLTMMSSLSSSEAIHKLLKLNLHSDDKSKNSEIVADMVIKCSAQEKTYSKFFADIGEKLCAVNTKWHRIFVERFKHYYATIHQFETNSLRNLGKFFGHLFASDRLSIEQAWSDIILNEEHTNPAIRVFLKFIFQEMVEELGINELSARLISDSYVKPHIRGVFPVTDATWDDASDLRFSINFFTAIGLGVLTEEMRDVLASLQPPTDGPRGRQSTRSGSVSSSGSSRSFSRSRSASYSSREASYSRSNSPSRTPSRSTSPRRESAPGGR